MNDEKFDETMLNILIGIILTLFGSIIIFVLYSIFLAVFTPLPNSSESNKTTQSYIILTDENGSSYKAYLEPIEEETHEE